METIVVGFDGSKPALEALHWAADEAAVRGSEVLVIQSWMEPLYGESAWLDIATAVERMRARAEEDVRAAVVTASRAHPEVPFTTSLSDDTPADALVDASEDAALVVLGARGRGGFASLLLGSVSQRVAAAAKATVVVVRGRGNPAGEVVVGVDGSTSSRAALRWAADEARRRGVGLRAVLAWTYLMPVGVHGLEPFRAEYTERDAREALEAIVGEVLGPDPDLPVRLDVVCDAAAPALIDRGAEASLLVVGPRAESLQSHLHLGSVTMRVLHHAPCPLVIVHPPADAPAPEEGSR